MLGSGERCHCRGAGLTVTTTASSEMRARGWTGISRCIRPRSMPRTSSTSATTATLTGRSSARMTVRGACSACTRRASRDAEYLQERKGTLRMALAEVFESFVGPDAPLEFAAYDGSRAGAAGSPVKMTVRSPVAVAHLAQAPGALGLARAYVSGHLDIEGDMYEALARMTKAQNISMTVAEKLRLPQALGGPKLLLPRLPPPPQEVRMKSRWRTGRLHSKDRDAGAISHHYDVSNQFYEWVIGPTMAYTCACYPSED